MALFDTFTAGEFISHITEDMNIIQDGISQKIGLIITAVSTFCTAIVVAFIKSWKLTFVLLSVIVSIILTMGGIGKMIVKYRAASAETRASSIAFVEEVLASARESLILDPHQQRFPKKFDELLRKSRYWGIRMQCCTGLMIAIMMCIVYLEYGLSFWQRSRFITSRDASVGDILTLMLAVLMGALHWEMSHHKYRP